MGLRILETSTGPVLVDDEPAPASRAPTELELFAETLGVDAEVLRDHLRHEVQVRRRARGDAWKQLDETIAKRENGQRPAD